MKKKVEIEALLHWAYRHELPKLGAEYGGHAGVAPGFSLVSFSRGADWHREPGYPAAMGSPHPDALVIGRIVDRLPPVVVDGRASLADLAPDFAASVPADSIVVRQMLVQVPALVALHARMGTRPRWEVGGWEVNALWGRNGRIRVEGTDDNGRYGWCPVEVLPDPCEVLSDRAEYACWQEALSTIAAEVANQCAEYTAEGPSAPSRPWMTGAQKSPTILPDLTKPWVSLRVPRRRRHKAA